MRKLAEQRQVSHKKKQEEGEAESRKNNSRKIKLWFHAENDQLNDDHTFAFNWCAQFFFFLSAIDHHITIDDSIELHAIELYIQGRKHKKKKKKKLIEIHNDKGMKNI